MSPAFDINIFIQALIVNGIIAVLAYFAKAVSKSGILGGLIVGIPIYTFMGWQGFVILFSMFAIGTTATKWGYQKKKEMGLAEKNEGQRGISNVLGKCLAGVLFATLYYYCKSQKISIIFEQVAFIGSFAAGTFDTVSSELGQLYGKRCITFAPFKKVTPGTEGAVSLEGSLFGFLATLAFTSLAIILLGVKNPYFPYFRIIIAVLISVMLSNLLESIIGSSDAPKIINNKFVTNFLNTFLGGLNTKLILIIICNFPS